MQKRNRKIVGIRQDIQRDIQPQSGFGIFTEFATEIVAPAIMLIVGIVLSFMIMWF
jgi:hypothetical protein